MRARLRFVIGAVLCASVAFAGCSSIQGGSSSIPQWAGNLARPGAAAQRVAAFAIGASDYCPSHLGRISLPFAAIDATGNEITGNFSNAISLDDKNHNGATHLSATSIRSAKQVVTLTYSKAADFEFTVVATTGSAANTAYLQFATDGPCINPRPSILVLGSGASKQVTLGGPKTGPKYELSSTLRGAGCNGNVTVSRKSDNTFEVARSSTARKGSCDIWAGSYGGFVKALPVLLTKT